MVARTDRPGSHRSTLTTFRFSDPEMLRCSRVTPRNGLVVASVPREATGQRPRNKAMRGTPGPRTNSSHQTIQHRLGGLQTRRGAVKLRAMRIVFLGVGAEQLPVEWLSAILKREGNEVGLAYHPSLFDDRFQLKIPALARLFDREQQLVDRAVAMRPDVIAMSVLTNTFQTGLAMARAIKDRTGAKVIFGGVHPSAVPDVVIAEDVVDAVCVGEGDVAFPAYLKALSSGDERPIPNLWFKAPDGRVVKGDQSGFIQELDALPFPDKALYEDEFDIANLYMTITGRGCPYRCTFCFNNFWAKLPSKSGNKGGRYVRQRSVDHVIAELKFAKRRWGIRYVDFEDDVFTVDKAWIQRFLEAYRREIKVPWMCLTHPKYVDEEIVSWMKEAGCTWVQLGIQSLDEHHKHKSMKRYEKVGDVAWALDAFDRAGIRVRGDHIFGSAGEPAESQEVAREFYAAHTPARISTYWMTYLPGVEITDQALARGELTQDDVDRLAKGLAPAFHGFGGVRSKSEQRRFANYETLFRLMPAIPKALRNKAKSEWFDRVPMPALRAISVAADMAVAAAQQNPNHIQYAQYYLRQLGRHVARDLGLLSERIELQSGLDETMVPKPENRPLVQLGGPADEGA